MQKETVHLLSRVLATMAKVQMRSYTQRIKWPTDGWGLVYETNVQAPPCLRCHIKANYHSASCLRMAVVSRQHEKAGPAVRIDCSGSELLNCFTII